MSCTEWLKLIAAYKSGQSSQAATDAQAVVAKQAEVSDAMRQVDATTTHSDADVDERLRDGTF